MKASINREGCIACGQCVEICPEVFAQDEDGIAYVHQDVPAEAEEGAVTAQESCPVSVITVND